MKLEKRINALARLGKHLLGKDEYLEAVMERTKHHNPWFTVENQKRAVAAIASGFLQKDKLEKWAAKYDLKEPAPPKWVGLVMAGNIPLVGFHDLICVFVAGHRARIKLSDKDKFLLPYLLKLLSGFDAGAGGYFETVERLSEMDAVIATGSNNSSRYFEAYFGKYPHIIRRNRNGVAVLEGSETRANLLELGNDVFRYFGLGCRNVSKIYLPKGYDMQPMLEQFHEFREMVRHHKYKNNFDYNLALLMMNRTKYWNNGCIILTENESIASRIAMLHFEHFENKKELAKKLRERAGDIQCIVAKAPFEGLSTVGFGQAQCPSLVNFPDGVDVMSFLSNMS